MSDLRPRGIPIEINGVERKILFTLNAIDMIQEKYKKTLSEVLDMMLEGNLSDHVLRDVLLILLEDEREREKYKDPDINIEQLTVKELGWFLSIDNQYDVMKLIFRAYGISIPEPEEDDPNQESGQQSN